MERELGTVITTFDGPNTREFSFVINDLQAKNIHCGEFISIHENHGFLIGTIVDIIKTNSYYKKAESVREYERGGGSLISIFPTDRWEFMVARVKPLGLHVNGKMERVTQPPSPGSKVFRADDELLARVLGFELESGIMLGNLNHHEIPVKLDLTRFIQKHVAILAMSGAGKSYTTAVLLEELLNRNKEHGRIAVVLIDVHGEYDSFSYKPENGEFQDFSERVKVYPSPFISLQTSLLSARELSHFIPQISPIQTRELQKIHDQLRKERKNFSLDDLIEEIEHSEEIKTQTKEALLSWLLDLKRLNIFGSKESPALKDEIHPGKCLIFDLSETLNLRKKQIMVHYIAQRLFWLRKNEQIPPFMLILEEAHQFVPEGSKKEMAISRSILETYAREGRKFGAALCLLSQRPVKLSTTVLSQCGTHVILRITNPNDLDHIRQSSEQITRESLEMISTLPVGEALITGVAVNHPIFLKVRKRTSSDQTKFLKLDQLAKKFDT
ncbi:MAG: ATP-binding protein [Candidatus Helarchaeales archaeon]